MFWENEQEIRSKDLSDMQKPWSHLCVLSTLAGGWVHLELSLPSAKKAGAARVQAGESWGRGRAPCNAPLAARIAMPCRFPSDWDTEDSQYVQPT